MGRMQAEEMAAQDIKLEVAVEWQLRSNHYPPVPMEMVAIAVKAIKLCREGKYDETIKTPFEHTTYGWDVPARIVVESYRLEPWCYDEEDEDYGEY